MVFKSGYTKRIDFLGNMKMAEMVANIGIQAIDEEYVKLQRFLDENTLVIECKHYLEVNDKQEKIQVRKSLNNALFELRTMLTTYCENILGLKNPEKDKAYRDYLDDIDRDVGSDKPSYEFIFEIYQKLIAKMCLLTNRKKVEIMTENINTTKNTNLTEVEYKRCVIL